MTAAALRPRLGAESGLLRRLVSARNVIVLFVVAVVAWLGAVPLGFLLWRTFVRGGSITLSLSSPSSSVRIVSPCSLNSGARRGALGSPPNCTGVATSRNGTPSFVCTSWT